MSNNPESRGLFQLNDGRSIPEVKLLNDTLDRELTETEILAATRMQEMYEAVIEMRDFVRKIEEMTKRMPPGMGSLMGMPMSSNPPR